MGELSAAGRFCDFPILCRVESRKMTEQNVSKPARETTPRKVGTSLLRTDWGLSLTNTVLIKNLTCLEEN